MHVKYAKYIFFFTFLFTWVFIQLMAFSGPINLYLTGISKPNRACQLPHNRIDNDGSTWQ